MIVLEGLHSPSFPSRTPGALTHQPDMVMGDYVTWSVVYLDLTFWKTSILRHNTFAPLRERLKTDFLQSLCI